MVTVRPGVRTPVHTTIRSRGLGVSSLSSPISSSTGHRIAAVGLLLLLMATLPLPASETERPTRAGDSGRAMWVWDADPLLTDARARAELIAFSRLQRVGTLWVQVGVTAGSTRGGIEPASLRNPAAWRVFIADAHRAGLRVEALDGAPEYALAELHHVPLGVVDAIIAFNDASAPEERFDGVHFDNEPYLLPGWSDPEERTRILEEYLALNAEAQRRIRERSSMVFGVDLPFWWHYVNDATGRAHAEVEFRGVRKAATFHCIDLLDNVGIMNYRNVAEGTDGLIAHALAILSYAEQTRGAKIYMGVDTSIAEPRTYWFAAGLPSRDFFRLARSEGRRTRIAREIGGFGTRTFSDGANIHVGLRVPREAERSDDTRLRQAMAELAERYGAAGQPAQRVRAEQAWARALNALRRDPEWIEEQDRPILGPDGRLISPGFQATAITLPKLTFAVKSAADMRRELGIAEEKFRQYSQYAGIAVHHYESYRRLVGG